MSVGLFSADSQIVFKLKRVVLESVRLSGRLDSVW